MDSKQYAYNQLKRDIENKMRSNPETMAMLENMSFDDWVQYAIETAAQNAVLTSLIDHGQADMTFLRGLVSDLTNIIRDMDASTKVERMTDILDSTPYRQNN